MNLYNKYRPSSFEEVHGNQETISYLESMVTQKKKPQALLFYGATGCGKTTLARIVSIKLGCGEMDIQEVNSANFRGIDTVRGLINNSKYKSMTGSARVWIIDEVHKMTGDAQNAMLKLLEDPIDDLYFILCTTDPQKLLKTVRDRCIQLPMNPLSEAQIIKLLKSIAKQEAVKVSEDLLERVAEETIGHPRRAIQMLEKLLNVPKKKRLKMLETIASEQSLSFELCKALLTKSPWKKVSNILKGLKGQDAEGIRRHVMAYAESALIKSDNQRAAAVLEEFIEPVYDSGFAGIVLYCYIIIKG